MTAVGRIEAEFLAFKEEVLARLDAIENKKAETKKPVKKTEVILEAKGNEVIGTEVDAE